MSRIALVTGGTRGIGRAISLALNAAGYTVAANYARDEAAAARLGEEAGIATYAWSVADYDECAAGVARVEAELGPVEILVNNAGITRDMAFHKMTPQAWREVIDTNLSGVFNMTRPVWPGMRERGFGRVITISSVNAQKGQFGQANYAAAKAGDLGIARAGRGGRGPGHHGERDLSGLCGDRDGARHAGRTPPAGEGANPGGAAGPARGDRAYSAVPGRGRSRFHYRIDVQHQWRSVHVLKAEPVTCSQRPDFALLAA